MKDRSNEGKTGLGKATTKIVRGKPGADSQKQSVLDVPRKAVVSTGLSDD